MSFRVLRINALVHACLKGYPRLCQFLIDGTISDPKRMGAMEPGLMASRLGARLEEYQPDSMPLANTIKLVDKDTQCEVYLYGLYPRCVCSFLYFFSRVCSGKISVKQSGLMVRACREHARREMH